MELYNKNKKYPSFGKYPSIQGKLNQLFSNENNKFLDNLNSTKNILRSSMPHLKEFCNKTYNKNSKIVSFPLRDYELINLKRKEAPHVFQTRYKYIDENRKRLFNKKLYSPKNNASPKLINTYFSIFHQSGKTFAKHLKLFDNNYVTIPSEEYINSDSSIKRRTITNYSNKKKISEKLIKFNNKKRSNEIFLPSDLEYKHKNYMQLNDDGNFMEKYQYYLLNLNKNKNNSLNKQKSKVENKNINNYNKENISYFKSHNNIFNNNIHQIKPYKYKQYYYNSEKNNFQRESLTDRVTNITKSNKYLSKYLDDSYIKKIKKISYDNNKNKNNKSKIVYSTKKENNYLKKNYLEESISQLNRRVLCINEKNEDIILRKAINLLEKENEKLTDEVDKNMNIFCKIKNFSFTQENEFLIPLINEVIFRKIFQKKEGTKIEGKILTSDDKNKNKNYILNKELKVFDLEKNQKFIDEDKKEREGMEEIEERENNLENMYLNFIKKKIIKKGKNSHKIEKSDNILDNITQILFKSEKKLQKNKSYDNKDNLEENKLINNPSSNNTNKKTKLFKNPNKNKNIKESSKNVKQKLPLKLQLNFFANANSLAKLTRSKKANLQNNTERIIKKNFRINENANNKNSDNRSNCSKSKNNDLNKDTDNIKGEDKINNFEENIKFEDNDKESLDIQITNEEPIDQKTFKNIIYDHQTEKDKINYLKIHELLIKEDRNNISKNYINQNKFVRRNNLKTKSIYYKLKANLDKISYTINNFNTDNNNDSELNEAKKPNFERKKRNLMTTIFRDLPKNTIKKKKSKSPRKKQKNKTRNKDNNTNKSIINYNEQSKEETNNYIKFMNALKKEEESKIPKNENKNILFSKKSPKKSSKKATRLSLVDKISKNPKKILKQKTFKNLKDEPVSGEESESINYKEHQKAEKKIKPKSNLIQFKDEINKMKNMSVNDYVKFMENYFSPKEHIDTNITVGQERINKFLDGMRKNIEIFKGKQNILTINCQPIDYFLTIGNGFGNYFVDNKEKNKSEESS